MSTDQINQESLSTLALEWVKQQEAIVCKHGVTLGPRQIEDAKLVGVQDPFRVRALLVDRMPMPGDPELAAAARRAQIITETSRGITVGHGIIIRAEFWKDRELLLHLLVHVAQCERAGGLDLFVGQYVNDRTTCAEFSVGSLEEEARRVAREIVSGKIAAK